MKRKGGFPVLAAMFLALVMTGCGGGGGGDSSPTAPAAPTGVTAAAGDNSASISWAAVAGATSYNIYYSTTTGVTKANGIKITGATSPSIVTGLVNGTTHYFVVTAVNAVGESAESSQVSAIPTPIPAAPTDVNATAGNGAVTIGWSAVSGATSYNIYHSTTAGVTKATGDRITGVNSPHAVTGLTNDTTYYFVVTAVNAVGESPESGQVSATPNIIPPAPTGVSATAGSRDATIAWSAVTGAASYNIYFSLTPGVTKATGTKVAGVTSPSIVTGLTNGTPYYFVVTAVNFVGVEGPESAQVTATPTPDPPPPAPLDVTASEGFGEVAVGWSPVVGATLYNLYYSTTSPVTKTTGIKVAGVTSPEVVTGLDIGTRYYFRVTAENADGESGLSLEATGIQYFEYIAVGDSITEGTGDDIPSDGIGFEPILSNLLGVTIATEGAPGKDSSYGAANISSTLAKYSSEIYYLVLYGTNDADTDGGQLPTPSGRGLNPGDNGYAGSYKDNMQQIVSAILGAGKTPYLAKIPFTTNPRYSVTAIQEYNEVVDELVAENGITVIPPDFFSLFQNNTSLLNADGVHPNGTGYQSMATLWRDALAGP